MRSGRRGALRPDGQDDQEEDRRADRRVGDIERVPAPAADAGVHEVHDVAQPQPVDEVADRAADEQAQSQRDEEVLAGPRLVPDDDAQHGQADQREQQGRALEHPEQRTLVVRQGDPDEVARDLHGTADLERAGTHDPCLDELIDDQHRAAEAGKQAPAWPVDRPGLSIAGGRRHGLPRRLATLRHVVPAYPSSERRRRPTVTGPASRSTVAVVAPGGGEVRTTWPASVSVATAARCASTPEVSPSTHRVIWSVSRSSASLRRSWIARCSSRASPSARSSGVSRVSMTTTRPSSWATAVPGRGVSWISTSSAARLSPASRTPPSASISTSPARAAAMTAGIAAPSFLPIRGKSGLTRRSTRSDSAPISSMALTLTSSRTRSSRASRSVSAIPGRPSHIRASGWRTFSPAVPRRVRARSTARRATDIDVSSAGSRSLVTSAAGHRVRWTESGAAGSIPVMRFVYIASDRNGRSGARTRARTTRAAWSEANAAARSAGSSLREKRRRDRRTYQLDRSSTNEEMRRVAPSAS